LVLGYFFSVITALSTFLKDLFDQNLPAYAVVAWALIAGQGVLLEIIAVAVQRIIRAVRSEND
jgi:enamine deaminase RidA (YjgF/YER057c/UK114 family)